MPIVHAKLTLQNNQQQEITVEALNSEPDNPTTPKLFGLLLIALAEMVGEATSQTPGFIEWPEKKPQ